MNIYPITIPTLCRYEHFKKCVESLSRCKYADQTELIIGLDYPLNSSHVEGHKLIENYIPSITGFKKVSVFKQDHNVGCSVNSGTLRKYAFEKYDAVIVTEDDNEFSPCFLEFINTALDEFSNNPKVSSVCGYSQPKYYKPNIKDNSICTYDNCAWGLGLWREKEKNNNMTLDRFKKIIKSYRLTLKIFMYSPKIMYMLLYMVKRNTIYGDVMRTCNNILNDTYQLKPIKSLVRNNGNDGSGENSKYDITMLKQEISTDISFGQIKVKLKQLPYIRKQQFYIGLPNNKLLAVMSSFVRLLVYVYNRCLSKV